jgi:HD-GYP domain-containing protein (c-di-GMP phosphodiesterase class II)
LLHDAGCTPASAELCRTLNVSEEALFRASQERLPKRIGMDVAPTCADDVAEAIEAHPGEGAAIARDLGFEDRVQAAITSHHERWDGEGYPNFLAGEDIPIAGRLVAAADLIEHLIATEGNPLSARRNLLSGLTEHIGRSLDPEIAKCARDLSRSDTFWLGLHSAELPRGVVSIYPKAAKEKTATPDTMMTFASVFARLADAKGEHTADHGSRTATCAVLLGEALGFGEERLAMLELAALTHDVGLLGVPSYVIAKPDILSLTEMESMRKHPTYSQIVLEAIPGLEAASRWAGAHHERSDGKGYPELLEGGEIPLESRIIAVADTYVALTSERPYRSKLAHDQAIRVLVGGSGVQLDPELVDLFCSLELPATSSRTSRRSARKR